MKEKKEGRKGRKRASTKRGNSRNKRQVVWRRKGGGLVDQPNASPFFPFSLPPLSLKPLITAT